MRVVLVGMNGPAKNRAFLKNTKGMAVRRKSEVVMYKKSHCLEQENLGDEV